MSIDQSQDDEQQYAEFPRELSEEAQKLCNIPLIF